MIITIFASIGSQNLGDELILKNEIKILKLKYSKLKNISENEIFFKVFTYDIKDIFYKDKNIEYIEYFPIDIKNKKNIFRNIRNIINFIKTTIRSDLIVIGGGGLFYDNENQSVGNPLKQWNFRSKIFRFFKKEVEFFRVGLNIKKDVNLYLISNIFFRAKNISVRDDYSFELLAKLGFSRKLTKENDPVFWDNIKDGKDISFKKNILRGIMKSDELKLGKIEEMQESSKFYKRLKGKKIGFALRDLDIKDYNENILEILKFLLEKEAEIVLIPHSFHKTDKKANDYVFFEKINIILSTEGFSPLYICKSMKESYENYKNKKIDFNLASRLHSIILSQIYEIPFIGISYSTKTDEVLKILSKKK